MKFPSESVSVRINFSKCVAKNLCLPSMKLPRATVSLSLLPNYVVKYKSQEVAITPIYASYYRGSFRTGSTGSWEPVNFEESYTGVKILGKNITEYLIISLMQNLGTRQLNFLTELLVQGPRRKIKLMGSNPFW